MIPVIETHRMSNLDRSTIAEAQKEKLSEIAVLKNAANKQKPTLPDYNKYFQDKSLEANNMWLNCLNRFTNNFTRQGRKSVRKTIKI